MRKNYTFGILFLVFGLLGGFSSFGQNPTISILNTPAIEGENVIFTVSLNFASDVSTIIQVIGVPYFLIDGPEYNLYTTYLEIPIGQTNVQFEVETLEDLIGEPTQIFDICLLVTSGNTINGELCSTFTIYDDDPNIVGAIIAEDETLNYELSAVATSYSVLSNDSINGIPVTANSVILTPISLPAGFQLSPNGTISMQGNEPSGTYIIEYKICALSDLSNCDNATVTINIGNLSKNNFTFNNFKSFPNPVKNTLTISNDSAIENIEISSILGQKMIAKKVNDFQTEVYLSQLSNGIYFVKVTSQGNEKIFKIIKE